MVEISASVVELFNLQHNDIHFLFLSKSQLEEFRSFSSPFTSDINVESLLVDHSLLPVPLSVAFVNSTIDNKPPIQQPISKTTKSQISTSNTSKKSLNAVSLNSINADYALYGLELKLLKNPLSTVLRSSQKYLATNDWLEAKHEFDTLFVLNRIDQLKQNAK